MNELNETLIAGASALGLELTARHMEQYNKFYKLLIEANKFFNLTAITSARDVALKHIIDSLTCLTAAAINEQMMVVDIGTGAGFPGIPLKIYRPGIRLTMVDSLEKRVKFLNDTVAGLGLQGTTVIHARAEDFCNDKEHREKYDLAVARAVAGLPVLLEYCLPAVKKGGLFLAMKGPKVEEEIAGARNALEVLGGVLEGVINLNLPLGGEERNLVKIRKAGHTPARYPRRAGIPQKKPL